MSQQVNYSIPNQYKNNVNANYQKPVMQGNDDNALKRAVSTDGDNKEKIAVGVLTAPMMLALYKTMEGYSKINGGAYEKSLAGRMANLGDTIATSSVGKPAGKVFGTIGKYWEKLVGKSKILTAFFKMPSMPENAFAKGLLHGTDKQLGEEFISFVKKYTKKGGNINDLAGLTDEAFKNIQNMISSDSPSKVKNGLEEILKICEKVKDSKSVRMDNYLGRLTGRSVTLEQIGNQIRSVTKAKTKLGKILPKIGIRGLHGLTFGGGIFMILSAYSLANAAVKARKAEKGDRFKTYMEEFLSNISWVVTMPLSAKIMNAFQGLGNIGMTPYKLAKYRKALKVHNSTQFADKAAWKASRDALKAMRKTGKVGFFGKIFKGIGRFFTTGREVIKPYIIANPTTKAEQFKNYMAKSKFFGRNALAYPIGLGIYMFLCSPIAEKLFVKTSHAIFGKPKHSLYDEDKEQEQLEEVQKAAQEAIQSQAATQDADMTQATKIPEIKPKDPNTYTSDSNLIKIKMNGGGVNERNGEPVRTYIPSPEGVIVAGPDTSGLDKAFADADKIEQDIQGVLKMQ